MTTILNILLFILSFSILIVVHELGHLTAAKIFKVYCFDFSIGFGPAFVHVKRKKGETYFSLRAIPFGGYVSMYGEESETPEGIDVPIERSVEGVKKWKKAIIMGAGIFMNALLAIILFYTSAQFFPNQTIYINVIEVSENSIAGRAGLQSHDIISYVDLSEIMDEDQLKLETESLYYFDVEGTAVFASGGTQTIRVGMTTNNITPTSLDLNSFIKAYQVTYEDNKITYSNVLNYPDIASINFNINTIEKDTNDEIVLIAHSVTLNVIEKEKTKTFEPLGISFYLDSHSNSFPEAVKQTFVDFGESSILIFQSVGNLLAGKGWADVGGPVAIYGVTTSVLQNYGVGTFIYMWGVISVNLAIINLLPFPGLDGWHLLVVIIEGITRKKIPNKVKNIVSFIGIVLLFALMIIILLKDIIGLF